MARRNVMLDLETMGIGANSVILSIGAVEFTNTGLTREFYRVIDRQSCLAVGLKEDIETIKWWNSQPEDVRKILDQSAYFGVSLRMALGDFMTFLQARGRKGLALWGNGADFDNVILANAYKASGFVTPWKYQDNRCYRTLKNLYLDVPAPERIGQPHHALDDAKTQALHLIEIAKRAGLWRRMWRG